MNILEHFISLAEGKKKHVGIGLGSSKEQNMKILDASLDFVARGNTQISLFGKEDGINLVKNDSRWQAKGENIHLIQSQDPERAIVLALQLKEIDGIVRGSMSSSKFLSTLKKEKRLKEINRLALLETAKGHQFFYGPVGIDECNTKEKKTLFIEAAISIMERLDMTPRISVLSGGRKGDLGRDSMVDETIFNATLMVDHFKEKRPSLDIVHDEILIERAIEKKSNLIIAPEGISGNLIYRTLVHLGQGKAHGAIYMGINEPIIDTSRVGKRSEIEGAIWMIKALSP